MGELSVTVGARLDSRAGLDGPGGISGSAATPHQILKLPLWMHKTQEFCPELAVGVPGPEVRRLKPETRLRSRVLRSRIPEKRPDQLDKRLRFMAGDDVIDSVACPAVMR